MPKLKCQINAQCHNVQGSRVRFLILELEISFGIGIFIAMPPKPTRRQKRLPAANCFFCTQNVVDIDYKDIPSLRKFISAQAKVLPPRKTGVCATHQRRLARSIKRARFLALLPYTTR